MTRVKIFKLPQTQDEGILSRRYGPMRALRLKSLQTDAANFQSKYSDEVSQPREFWLNRLRDQRAEHWIVCDIDIPAPDENMEAEYSFKWIAFLVVLATGRQPVTDITPGNIGNMKPEVCEHYQMGALYVDPDYRGQSIAAKLMSAALHNLKVDARGQKIIVTLSVREHNAPAICIYQKFGFTKVGQEIEETSSGEKDIMDLMRLELISDPISKA